MYKGCSIDLPTPALSGSGYRVYSQLRQSCGHPLTGHLPVDGKGTNKKGNLQGLWDENFPSLSFLKNEGSL